MNNNIICFNNLKNKQFLIKIKYKIILTKNGYIILIRLIKLTINWRKQRKYHYLK